MFNVISFAFDGEFSNIPAGESPVSFTEVGVVLFFI